MNKKDDKLPLIGSEGYFYMDEEETKLFDNTSIHGLNDFVVYETIQKIRNYYNGHHNIDGRPPSRKDFNEFLDSLEKIF